MCFFRITRTFLIYPTDRCFAFTVSMTVIVSTTNVGLRRSCWDAAFTTPDWSWFLTPTRYSLVNCCLFLSTRSTRSHVMGAAWFISWQRPPWSYTINWCHVSRCCRPMQLMSMLSTRHSACIQQQAYALSWLQLAATVWMHVMLSLKDSRHGLSSIYNFFSTSRKAQHSALLAVLRSSTETRSEISAYADSGWTVFFSSSSLHAVTLLSASMFATKGGMTPASDEIVTNSASANELCFLQIHGAVCMTEGLRMIFCLTVNGSSRVKRCI